MALGALGASVLGQLGPNPLVTPSVAIGVCAAAALLGRAWMRETPHDPVALDLRIQPPRVPAGIRAEFRFSALGVFAAWAVLGLYLSLGPKPAEQTVDSRNLLVGGVVITAMVGDGLTWTYRVFAVIVALGCLTAAWLGRRITRDTC